MNPAWFLIVVIGIVTSIVSKKRKEEMKKKAEQKPTFPPQYSPNAQMRPASKPATGANRSASSAVPGKSPARGVDSKWPWPTAAEKAQGKTKPAASTNYGGTPRYTHVVTSSNLYTTDFCITD